MVAIEHLKTLAEGLAAGAVVGVVGYALNRCAMDGDQMAGRCFLNGHADMSAHFGRLKELLRVDGRGAPVELERVLDTICGYDVITDLPDEYPLHLTYTTAHAAHAAKVLIIEIIKGPFQIPSIGAEVCKCAEEIGRIVDDIKYNVVQETNLRVMS
jgi:hypothetical protein